MGTGWFHVSPGSAWGENNPRAGEAGESVPQRRSPRRVRKGGKKNTHARTLTHTHTHREREREEEKIQPRIKRENFERTRRQEGSAAPPVPPGSAWFRPLHQLDAPLVIVFENRTSYF